MIDTLTYIGVIASLALLACCIAGGATLDRPRTQRVLSVAVSLLAGFVVFTMVAVFMVSLGEF